jgi:hypothetical protein
MVISAPYSGGRACQARLFPGAGQGDLPSPSLPTSLKCPFIEADLRVWERGRKPLVRGRKSIQDKTQTAGEAFGNVWAERENLTSPQKVREGASPVSRDRPRLSLVTPAAQGIPASRAGIHQDARRHVKSGNENCARLSGSWPFGSVGARRAEDESFPWQVGASYNIHRLVQLREEPRAVLRRHRSRPAG